MTSKEIELVLQAKLEEGDTVSQAQMLGQNIVSALENAFKDLGEKIAAQLFGAIQTQAQSFQFQLTGMGGGSQNSQIGFTGTAPGRAPSPGGGDFERFAQLTAAAAGTEYSQSRQMGAALSGQAPRVETNTAEANAVAANQNLSFRDRVVLNDAQTKYNLLGNIYGSALTGTMGGEASREFNQQIREDFGENRGLFNQYRRKLRYQELNPDYQIDNDFLSKVGQSQQRAVKDVIASEAKMSGLEFQIQKLTDALEKNTLGLGKVDQEIGQLNDEQLKSPEGQSLLGERQGRLDQDRSMRNHLGALRDEYDEIDQSTKETMEGQRVLNQQQAKQEQKRRSEFMAQITTGVKTAGLVGEAVGFASDFPMMVARGRAGSAELGGMGTRSAMGHDYRDLLAQSELGGEGQLSFFSRLQAGGSALGKIAVGGAGVAAGLLGAGETAGLTLPIAYAGGKAVMSGVSDFTQLDARAASIAQERLSLQKLENKEVYDSTMASVNYNTSNYTAAQGMGAPGLSGTLSDVGLLRGMRNSGLTQDQREGLVRNVVAGMGGFGMESGTGFGPSSNLAIMGGAQAMGRGFTNFAQVSSSLMAGSDFGTSMDLNRSASMNRSVGLFDFGQESNIDESQLPGMLGYMADSARGNYARGDMASLAYTSGVSQAAYLNPGAGPDILGRYASTIQHIGQSVMDSGKNGNDLNASARMQAVIELGQKYAKGGKFNAGELGELMHMDVDEAGFKRLGLKDPKKAHEAFVEFQNLKHRDLVRAYKSATGSESLGTEEAARSVGVADSTSLEIFKRSAGLAFASGTTPSPSVLAAHQQGNEAPGKKVVDETANLDTSKLTEGFSNLAATTSLLATAFETAIKRLHGLNTTRATGPSTSPVSYSAAKGGPPPQ